MGFEISGLDDLNRQLDRMQQGVQKETGTRPFPLDAFVTPAFLARYTDFATLADLFAHWGHPNLTQEEFEQADLNSLNRFIARTTLFPTWHDLLQTAYAEHLTPILQERFRS